MAAFQRITTTIKECIEQHIRNPNIVITQEYINYCKQPNKYHIFLWVSHGSHALSTGEHVPLEFKYKSIGFYSSPLKLANISELKDITESNQIIGKCPKIPFHNGTKRLVIVPPLFFRMTNEDKVISDIYTASNGEKLPTSISTFMGLYHIILDDSKDISQMLFTSAGMYDDTTIDRIIKSKTLGVNKIMTFNDAMLAAKDSNGFFTYSFILNLIHNKCKLLFGEKYTKDFMENNISINLFSCQIYQPYDKTSVRTIGELIPSMKKTIYRYPHTIIHESIDSISKSIEGTEKTIALSRWDINPNQLTVNQLRTPLVPSKYVGCGLILLHQFGFLSTNNSISELTCIPMTGTHIFNMIKLLNNNPENEFVVVRYSNHEEVARILGKTFSNGYYDNTLIVIKIYDKQFQDNKFNNSGKQKLSQVGHYIGICKIDGNIYWADPQGTSEHTPYQNDPKITGATGIFDLLSDSISDDNTLNRFVNKFIKCFSKYQPSRIGPNSAIDLIYTIRNFRPEEKRLNLQYNEWRVENRINTITNEGDEDNNIIVYDSSFEHTNNFSGGNSKTKKHSKKNSKLNNTKINKSNLLLNNNLIKTKQDYKKLVEKINKMTHTKQLESLKYF